MHPNTDEPLSDEDYQAQLQERLQTFGARLSRLASEQAGKRTEIEARWLDDLRQFHGEYTPDEQARLAAADGSQVYVNVTRNKTNAAEARLQDMLFPTDDRNFGIRPTPVPELDRIEPGTTTPGPDGQPVDMGKVADEIMREAKKKASAMQQQIDDQLTEARYQIKSRDIIHDAAQLGTGVIKGPVIVGRSKKRWRTDPTGLSTLQIQETLEPTVERVDVWDFFPDMSARTIEEAEFIFERRRMSKKQLRDFVKLPGVMVDQVRELVKQEAKSTHIARDYLDDIRAITGIDTVGGGNKFEVWEYHGPISKSELLDALEVTGELSEDDGEIDELDDEMEAVVFFSGNSVLKVVLNPMDTDERPYSVFNWEKDESSIFGFGVPYLMRNPQRVINAAWRMIMDNAGASVSDILVINRELVTPADGTWSAATGKKKLYFLKDKTRDVRECFAAFTIPNHQQELAAIFTMARQLADEETNLPLIAQGEQSANITKTSSGMAMLMNSANIVLRRAVKNWDDDMTRPTISRFYDWNMQFSEKAEIKGDYCIDARGSSALLVREKQQESLMILANISAGNPELNMRRDWAGLDREIAKALEVPYDNITKTDAEIEQLKQQQALAAQQQQDPMAQVKMQELQLKMQQLQFEQQFKMQQLQADMQQFQARLEQDRELRLADIAAREQLTVAQLQAKLQLEQMRDKTTRDKAATDAALKRNDTTLKAHNLALGRDTFG